LERITVLTPTLPERQQLLDECAASITAQSHPVSHLVGVDADREGPSVIRNRLAASTSADWFLPLDDDDLLDPDCVERLVEQSSDADVVVPWCRVVDVPGLEPWTPNRLFRPESMLLYNFVPVTALVRAELWREVGGMPEGVEVEDWLMWQRCLAAGARFRVVPEVCWTYRRGLAGSRNEWAAAAA
jgi:glycosyltransferase involved in cell wall biosynthesis